MHALREITLRETVKGLDTHRLELKSSLVR